MVNNRKVIHFRIDQCVSRDTQTLVGSADLRFELAVVRFGIHTLPDKYIPDDRSFSGRSCIDLGATMS